MASSLLGMGTVTRSGQSCKLTLQQVDLCDVAAHVVVAASLTGTESEPTACVRVANAGPAQVDEGGEVLALLERGGDDTAALERSRNPAIE
jgi:hypothetical protein